MISDGYSVEEVSESIEELIEYLIANYENLNIDKNKLAINKSYK